MAQDTTMSARVLALLATLAVGVPAVGVCQAPDSQVAVHRLRDADIQAAINLGRSTKDWVAFKGATTAGGRDSGHVEFTLTGQGPFGRIVSAAATSERSHRAFTADSVTNGMRAPVLVIEAIPRQYESLGDSLQIVAPATLIVLRRVRHDDPDDTSSIEPIRVKSFPVSQRNSTGGRFRGQGITAYFAIESVPADDFVIVVIAGGREYRRAIGKKDRENLR